MKSKELKFDVEEIENMRAQVEKTRVDLLSTSGKTVRLIEQLQKDWNTDAGKKLLKTVNTDWTEDVKKYAETLLVLDNILNEAKQHYSDVQEKVEALTFQKQHDELRFVIHQKEGNTWKKNYRIL